MKHLCTTALVASFAMAAPFAPTAADAEEINVVMFGMPYTNGLRKLAEAEDRSVPRARPW
ncbi:hypothetical protein MALG_04392 (plasmid) [Marinovum algicola DG 898]|nr:hypothetical protein MALG_04392 [Marinovum algicola DG 898]